MKRAVNEDSKLELFANAVKRVKLGPQTVVSLVASNEIHDRTARRYLNLLHEVGLVEREPGSGSRGDVYRWVA